MHLNRVLLLGIGVLACAAQIACVGGTGPGSNATGLTAPSIVTSPASQTVTAGQTATFSVVAAGSGTLSYQWQKNGKDISGNGSTYTTPATTAADNGSTFAVIVTNSAGATTSGVAVLTVTATASPVAPSITTQPANQTVTAGQTATFSVVATGTAPLSYQWKKNGAAISGAIGSSFTTAATTTADSGSTFSVTVTNSVSSLTSASATLTVNAAAVPPSITTQPASVTVTAGQTATFSMAATGATPLSYQWQKNGVAVSGATSSSYTTPATTSSDNGATFRVVVTNSAGTAASASATLTVNPSAVAPSITTQPASVTVTAGQTATFSVVATGTAPLTYQWKKNGSAVGTNSSSYTTAATTTADNGSTIVVTVTNSAGSATSATATLTVNPTTPPAVSITSPAAGATVSGTISVTASASDNVGVATVQLQVDGANLGVPDTTAPYNFSLDTPAFSNGTHSLTAVAKDTVGNSATSAAVSITVSNGTPSGTPGPLAVCTTNPRYFCDPNGNVVFLAGDHTWADLQDQGENQAPNTGAFDFNGYMSFLSSHGYTWLRLWAGMFSAYSSTQFDGPVWPWKRVGPGTADDGLLKTDFTQLDTTPTTGYFARLRSRIIQAEGNGLYVSVMLFGDVDGSDSYSANGDPFVSGNNVNGVSCSAPCPTTLPLNSTVSSYEQAYIEKVVDETHDLPNVMYEVANEPPTSSASWVAQVMSQVSTYEQTTYGTHHPIGINYGNNVPDSNVYDTNADYVSPSTKVPPAATGQCPTATGNGGAVNASSGRCKVVINDSDHSYYYTVMQSDGPTGQIAWVWENFLQGNGVAFMDPFTDAMVPGRNNCTGAPTDGDAGLCGTNGLDPQWNQIRSAMADVITYVKKVSLVSMTPQGSLASSGYTLADPGSQYLVFGTSNSFTLTMVPGTYTFEWFNPSTHAVVQTGTITAVANQTLTAPFSGAAVLWLHQ